MTRTWQWTRSAPVSRRVHERRWPVPKNQAKRTRVETTVHDEAHRSNIPTTELGSFLSDQDKEPRAILYPRDPSLDPQLVWKGKDEQDRHPLEVPAGPIYIQGKIQPKPLIDALRAA